MRAAILGAVIAAALVPTVAAADPICTMAADRMAEVLAEVSPEFRDAFASKSADEREALLADTAADLEQNGGSEYCAFVLVAPDSTIRAMARFGLRPE